MKASHLFDLGPGRGLHAPPPTMDWQGTEGSREIGNSTPESYCYSLTVMRKHVFSLHLSILLASNWLKWQPTPVLLPGKSHVRSLVGYSPWGRKESDRTERCHLYSGLLLHIGSSTKVGKMTVPGSRLKNCSYNQLQQTETIFMISARRKSG